MMLLTLLLLINYLLPFLGEYESSREPQKPIKNWKWSCLWFLDQEGDDREV